MNKKISKAIIGAGFGLWIATMASIALAADAKAPQPKPLATCADGMVEYSVTGDHRGACSGHHGVVAWADGSPVHSHAPKTSYRKAGK